MVEDLKLELEKQRVSVSYIADSLSDRELSLEQTLEYSENIITHCFEIQDLIRRLRCEKRA